MSKNRKKKLELRTPSWADEEQIRIVYRLTRELTRATGRKYTVDHIIPLNGEKVSGLHIASNLQILPERMNNEKGNDFTPFSKYSIFKL